MDQGVIRLHLSTEASHCGNWDRLISDFFGFPLSVSSQQPSTLIFICHQRYTILAKEKGIKQHINFAYFF
jgi:hypothetical protein